VNSNPTGSKKKYWNILHKNIELPLLPALEQVQQRFSFAEKAIFYTLVIILCLSTFVLARAANTFFTTEIPLYGGSLKEGVIGSARFINPLLAVSDGDRDLSALIYSGLMKATPEGKLVPDLAEKYTLSDDGKTYTFTIRKDAIFQDNIPVTADDVLFTIEKAQDPSLKSPKRASWDSIVAKKIDERTVEFTLMQAYAPFLENTTLGILPKHLWQEATSDEFAFSLYNAEPIGSGPYKIRSIERNSSGIPTIYHLEPFQKYLGGRAYIEDLSIIFYPSEEELLTALKTDAIDNTYSISPEKVAEIKTARTDVTILTSPLPRIFAVFFNQNQATVFTKTEVRKALDAAVDKDALVTSVLDGFGVPIDGPIPETFITSTKKSAATDTDRIQRARTILEKGGWTLNSDTNTYELKGATKKAKPTPLAFSISTSNILELKHAAEILKATWEKMGAKVDLQVYDLNDLHQNVIRPRKYDALLFGQVVGRGLDLFAFWHSSQRNDPGLNIALYTNSKADKLLVDGRKQSDPSLRLEDYRTFDDIIRDDTPAVFLYSPNFIYVTPARLRGVTLGTVVSPAERFLSINHWYVETERVWHLFAQ
jgi:peptide/nickel transport system substrate-binding protein